MRDLDCGGCGRGDSALGERQMRGASRGRAAHAAPRATLRGGWLMRVWMSRSRSAAIFCGSIAPERDGNRDGRLRRAGWQRWNRGSASLCERENFRAHLLLRERGSKAVAFHHEVPLPLHYFQEVACPSHEVHVVVEIGVRRRLAKEGDCQVRSSNTKDKLDR
jgi:hypothetical protein